STWPNALSSGRSTSFSAIRRSACSASGLSRSTSAWTRASRSEVSGAAGGGCLFNMLTFLALRPIGASDFSLLLPDYDYPQIFPPIFLRPTGGQGGAEILVHTPPQKICLAARPQPKESR